MITDVTDRINEIALEVDLLSARARVWADKVEADSSIPPAEIAVHFLRIKEAHEALDTAITGLYKVYEALDKHILPARIEDSGTDLIRVPSVARSFSVRNMLSASMVDKELAFKWLRSIGQQDLIQETVNAGTLAAFCRNLILEKNEEPPAEAVKLSPYKKIGINKYTPKLAPKGDSK